MRRGRDTGTAVLIDGDNVPPAVLGPVLERIEGPVTERRVWRNWRSQTDSQEWDAASKRHAYERVDRYKTSIAGKNASDIAVAIGAMDLFHGGIRRFCIVSGDTDFAPLIERLRRGGAHVIVVGHHDDPGLLEELADAYWTVPELLGQPATRARGGRGRQAQQAAPAKEAPKKAAKRGRKAGAPKQAAKQAPQQDTRAGGRKEQRRSFLADVYDTAVEEGRADDDGWVTVDGLGRVARGKGGFDAPRLGLPKRTTLNEAFRGEKDLFEVHAQTAKGGTRQVYRVRRR